MAYEVSSAEVLEFRKEFGIKYTSELIDLAYPDGFSPGNYYRVYPEQVTKEYVKGRVHRLVAKYERSKKDICMNFSFIFLLNNRLTSVLSMYNNSPYEILNTVYPGEFERGDLYGYKRKGIKKEIQCD